MSSINSISSLLSSLLDTQESLSTDDAEIIAEASELGITDSVILSAKSLELAKSLLDSLGDESTESDDSTDSMYDILTSAQNTKLIQNNPELVEMIMATDSSDATSINAIDLFELSSEDLLSIIEKYSGMSSSTTSSQIDEIV